MDIVDIRQSPIVTTGKQFFELCQPIFQKTPINYIGLCRIYNDGTRSYLISDPIWSSEVLLKNDYHLAGGEEHFMLASDASFHPWFLSSVFSATGTMEVFYRECVSFNYGNGITLIERSTDYVEFFHICADSGYEKVDEYLIHHVDMLWNFMLYLREAISKCKEVKQAYNTRLVVDKRLINKDSLAENKLNHFVLEKYYLGGLFGDVYFTKREMDCLVLSFRSLSSKQQAVSLGLSVRSIEGYLDGIREKIGCRTRHELILMLAQNNAFSALERHWVF